MPRGDMIVLRRDTLANWAAAEVSGPALAAGERGHITDLNVDVVGDGAKKVAQLTPVGSGTYARLPGPLGGWRAKVTSDPANAKMANVGDSTSDSATAASTMFSVLHALHTQPGEALYGVAPADGFTDGVTNGTTALTSATAAFAASDVGRGIYGRDIPAGTKISAVVNATTATLSQAASGSGSGRAFWVARHIIAGGNNGLTLQQWLAEPTGAFPYTQAKLIADDPDLIVYSWLLNDIRQGGLGTTLATIVPAGIARLTALIDWTRATLPRADILLRMPASILSANVGGLNFVSDGVTTNPAGLAQIYTTALRQIYLSFVGKYPNVDVMDTMTDRLFGSLAIASSPLMANQLHPSVGVLSDLYALTPRGGGYAALADALADRVGVPRGGFPAAAARARHDFIVYSAPSAGQVRLISRDAYGLPAQQAPVFAGDTLYVAGMETPITLTGVTVDRLVSATILQLTGVGSTDFSPYVGRAATVVGSHARMTSEDRQTVYIDLPSIAAGATVTQDVTVTGANADIFAATAVIASPHSGFLASGLLLLTAYSSAANTVRLVIQNPTGAAIDRPGESWNFWVIR